MSGEPPITLNTVHAEIKTLAINVEGIARLVTQHEKHLADVDDILRASELADTWKAGYTAGQGTIGISRRQLTAFGAVMAIVFSGANILVAIFLK